ncbi:hypothetical protein KOR42_03500 [Thalassoglobus neptunius]|uniref:Uncharacterized protein n=1 Tax=Thalassoglobus neptunius TaxID=1938619 RepID=A0A5C5X1I9_9PLAN|nr:hypothetical protein KOR42_03500 [Thalassoglobus neptunius]
MKTGEHMIRFRNWKEDRIHSDTNSRYTVKELCANGSADDVPSETSNESKLLDFVHLLEPFENSFRFSYSDLSVKANRTMLQERRVDSSHRCEKWVTR